MIKDIFSYKALCRSIFMMVGIFVFFAATQFAHATITDIQLNGGDSVNVNENTLGGTALGTLTTIGGNTPYTYELISGTGDEDNARFSISGDQFQLNFVPNYEVPVDAGDVSGNNTYTTRVRVTDSHVNFNELQSIATHGGNDWEHFQIGTDHYLVVANNFNDLTTEIDSKIYKWNGSSFVESQSIATNGAGDWEYFQIGTDHYLVVANLYNDTTYNIDSKIYKWNGTNFTESQSIATNGALDWEYFQIGTDYYLAVANFVDGSTYNIDSKIYKWNGTNFIESQSIATSGAIDWEHFQIGTDHYLAVSNRYNDTTYNIDSKIYKWNGSSFIESQSIATNGANNWEHFQIGTDHYLVVANLYNDTTYNIDSKIYKWNGTNFIESQSIATSGAADWEYFQIGTDHYLAVANYYDDVTYSTSSKIYKWNGLSFVESQSIATNGPVDWEYFQIDGVHYIVNANSRSDSTVNNDSKIYKSSIEEYEKQFTIVVEDMIEDLMIENSNITEIDDAIADGYISVDTGAVDNTDQVTTRANVTFTTNKGEVIFPTNTQITERANQNFNFHNFTIEEVNVSSEQMDSRAAMRLGIQNEKLDFSQDVTMTVYVGYAYNDLTMDVLYQEEGESIWNPHGTCVISEGNCTFTTNHATIYTINGQLQSEGDAPINLNTEVKDTLTLDCFDTATGTGDLNVTLGTAADPGKVTAGTPATGQSTCTVTTNDDQGYYLTIIDDNAATNTVLTHTDPHTGSTYEIQDLTQYAFNTPNTINWNAPTTKGLGFSVVTFPDTDLSNNQLNGTWTQTSQCPEGSNPDTNNYAGIPDTAETISAVTQYESLSTTTNICYKVDVPASQASGQYTGSVTYTATSDASSYLN